MPEPLRAGILGLGRSGWNIHADALADHDGFDVVAVADPVEDRRREAKDRFGCATYTDPDELIGQAEVDFVVVATPSNSHVRLGIAALQAGRHAVVEKPMAATTGEVDTMIEAATAAGRVLTCYQPRRFDPEFVVVREAIESGRLGEVLLIRHAQGRFTRRADWQTLRKFGGGELSNTVPHPLDQMLVLLGDRPVEVFADLRHTVGLGDAEDHVKLCLRAEGGAVADIESSLAMAIPQSSWQVYGTQGAVVIENGTATIRWLDPAALDTLSLNEGPATGRRYGTGEQIDWQEETRKVERGRSAALQFYDKLQGTLRDGDPVYVTPQSTRRQIDVIERARKQTGYA